MQALNVMIVDDSEFSRGKLHSILEEAGHRVIHVCTSGCDATAAYLAHRPDLVTMDISMPGMNGVEATRAILAQAPDALIVIVTAQGQEQLVIESIDAGAKAYLLKPVRPQALCDTLEKVWHKYAPKPHD